MTRLTFPGGSYCDSAPSGEYAVLYPGQFVQTHLGPVDLPGEDVLFLRITTFGGFGICGQGHDSGVAWQWRNGAWSEYGPTNGVSCVMFDKGGGLLIVRPGPDVTSQGYRQLDDAGEPIMGDASYADTARQIWEYSTLAGVTVGQGGNGGALVLGLGSPRVAEPGDTRFIRLHETAGLFSIAIVKPGEAVLLWATRNDLAALPLVTPDKPIDPDKPVDPTKPPEKHMQIPQKAKDNITALYERNKPLAQGSDDDRRALMKLINEQNRFDLGPKWGWKSADPTRPPGKDAIAYSETSDDNSDVWVADVFNGTTRLPSIPDEMDLPSPRQHFIAVDAVDHLGGGVVIPPIDPKPTDPALAELVAALADQMKAANALAAITSARCSALETTVAALDARLKVVERGSPGTVPPVVGVPSAKDIIDELVKRLKGLAA